MCRKRTETLAFMFFQAAVHLSLGLKALPPWLQIQVSLFISFSLSDFKVNSNELYEEVK